MTRARPDYRRSMAGSALLHGAVLAAALITWPWSRDLKIGTVTPVKIITNASVTDLRAASQAEQEQTAQTEAPTPDAPAEMVSPSPDTVEQPQPQAQPKSATTPAPSKSQPASKPDKSLDLDALAASLAKSTKGSSRSSAPKGANRAETAREAREAAGTGESAAALAGLTDDIQRLWNPNCDVEGGRDVRVAVRFTLDSGGKVRGRAEIVETSGSGPVAQAAAERAQRAVYGAAPFRGLPRALYNVPIKINFNARTACAG